MKKSIYITSVIIGILIMLCSCSTKEDKLTKGSIENITKITVTTIPGTNKSLKTTENKKEITDIANYINSLRLKETTKDAGEYNGMSYIITVYFNDKTRKEYILLGNMFFKESGKEWYEMQYDQAEKFESIYKGIGSK